MIDVRPVDLEDAKEAGGLLALTNIVDVVDALVALAALPGDQVLTSDPDDLLQLTRARGIGAVVVLV